MEREWHEKRRQGIGASEAGAICGISPWKSPYQVWLEKVGQAEPQPDSEPLYWGRALEPAIRQRYADETGRTVKIVGTFQSETHPFMFATPDGITDDNRLVEIKTSRSQEAWGEPGTAEVPEMYLCQAQHQMIVTGHMIVDIPVLIAGSDFRIYEVPADPVLQDLIVNKEAAFWEMVKAGTPPEPTTYADLKRRFGRESKAVTVQATLGVLASVARLKQLKEYEAEEENLKAQIMKAMGEADTLMDNGKVLATWKMAKATKRVDTKALLDRYPEIYKEVLKEGEPGRRLLIK